MKAVVGLGNPGTKYERTRHNIGRMAVRSFLERLLTPPLTPLLPSPSERRGDGDESEEGGQGVQSTQHDFSVVYRVGDLVLVVEPLVYMNVSGIAIKEIFQKYPVIPRECLIVYDDYAIPFGKLRARKRGGAGGHNGMGSVIAELQTDEIPRLRIGIGTEQPLADLTDYVLGEFTPQEQARLPEILTRAADAIECFIQTDIETVMNRFNAAS
ncbi:MAG: aminoacyl-tRNA hydrolase [Candidatus Bipolaricaulota bacterium]|nr:aminoacyl-tRNA hydrolase [Candidatus Bipolaricaulota bacterium]